jgi:hypothetical protein
MRTFSRCFTVLACLALSVCLPAQTQFNPTQINFVAHFASPPISPQVNTPYLFVDASASGVCSGIGTALAWCMWNGYSYAAVAASTGLGDPGSNSIPYRNSPGSTVPAVAGNFPTLNQSTTGNAGTATALAAAPSLCSTGYAPTGILASGNAVGCAQIQVPFGSQTANFFLAAPNGSSGSPAFRAIVPADIPTLNQSTTGNAGTATALAAAPSLCSTGYAPTGILASGNATGCALIAGGNVTGSGLTADYVIQGSGSNGIAVNPYFYYNGGTAFTGAYPGTIDMSGLMHSKPMVVASTSGSLPSGCTVGELGFVTGSIAGQNIWECNSGTWTQQLNSGGGAYQVDAVAAGAPSANCTAPTTSAIHTYIDSTNGDEWWCYATNSWKKMLSVTASGPWLVSGATGSAPSTPASGFVSCYFATSGGSAQVCLDSSGNSWQMVQATTLSHLQTRTAAMTDLAPATSDSGLILVINPPTAIVLTRVFCAVQGSTNVVINLDKRAEGTIGTDSGAHLLGSDLTAITGGANTSTFANGSGQCGGTSSCAIAAHAPVVLTITSMSGTPTALNCSIDYTVN